MEGNMNITNNFTLYLMLVVCVVLISVDSIELYRISLNWNNMDKFDPVIFDTCFKKELLIKTVFSIFSFMSAIAALLLTLLMVIDIQYFSEKLLSSYLNMIYYIFGPYMLGFAIYGIIRWDDVVYLCDRRDYRKQFFSFSNSFSLIGCLMISLVVTLGASVYETIMLYLNSILRRSEGSSILRSLFWGAVLRSSPEILRRPELDNPNQNIIENNV